MFSASEAFLTTASAELQLSSPYDVYPLSNSALRSKQKRLFPRKGEFLRKKNFQEKEKILIVEYNEYLSHILSLALGNSNFGSVYMSYPTDFNYLTRTVSSPTIGAYEYSAATNPGWQITPGAKSRVERNR